MRHRSAWAAIVLAALGGCATQDAAVDHEASTLPTSWGTRQLPEVLPAPPAPWRAAQPNDAAQKGRWWAAFNDPDLNALQDQALAQSQSLRVAAARLRQAHAALQFSGAAHLPRLDASLRDSRTRTSANRPATSNAAQAVSSIQNDHVLSLGVSYELDLFGRVREDIKGAQAAEQQSRAELENAQLVLSADLAAFYFNLRSLDAEIDVVSQGIAVQTRASSLLSARREGGAASGLDVAQQQALLDATRTQLELLKRQRQQLEHALATLVGVPAPNFSLPHADLPATAPVIPVALPSDVLERRPDVAAAERAVAVSNAQIGVARAAWFPSFTLNANGGWESRDIARLLDGPSLLWSLGSSVAQSVFDGGRNSARIEQARAAHEAASANYRQTVLRALQEVEDGLSGINALSAARVQSQAAVASAQKVLDIATDRYQGGLTTYLDVVTAQQNVLNNRRLSTQLLGQQLVTTTYLVKALGGSWTTADRDTVASTAK
ncbi:MAG: efflux transporter outer membrane subunit [Rubrivivax sp.]|nr:MAG: efflux transporter outer membrane subunit [Rubrivivax sp.]